MISVLMTIKGTVHARKLRSPSRPSLCETYRVEEIGARTPHQRSHAGDQAYDPGLNTGVGILPEGRIVGGRREIDYSQSGSENAQSWQKGRKDGLRARKRSSERIAMAFMRRTETGGSCVSGAWREDGRDVITIEKTPQEKHHLAGLERASVSGGKRSCRRRRRSCAVEVARSSILDTLDEYRCSAALSNQVVTTRISGGQVRGFRGEDRQSYSGPSSWPIQLDFVFDVSRCQEVWLLATAPDRNIMKSFESL
jgi:hypothetical protein